MAESGYLPNESYPGERLLARVGQITRVLHDSLRKLGYDKVLGETVAKIPDAPERFFTPDAVLDDAAQPAYKECETARELLHRCAACRSTL
mgnify:CR=1 FL=1